MQVQKKHQRARLLYAINNKQHASTNTARELNINFIVYKCSVLVLNNTLDLIPYAISNKKYASKNTAPVLNNINVIVYKCSLLVVNNTLDFLMVLMMSSMQVQNSTSAQQQYYSLQVQCTCPKNTVDFLMLLMQQ